MEKNNLNQSASGLKVAPVIEGPGGAGSGDDLASGSNIHDPGGVLGRTSMTISCLLDAPDTTEAHRKNLRKVQGIIGRIAGSDVKVVVETTPNDRDGLSEGLVAYKPGTGEVLLRIEEGCEGRLELVAHELVHVEQFLDGDWWYEDGEVKGRDIWDEVEAYQLQHDLNYPDGNSGSYDLRRNPVAGGGYRVTPQDVRDLYDVYGDLPDESRSKIV